MSKDLCATDVDYYESIEAEERRAEAEWANSDDYYEELRLERNERI